MAFSSRISVWCLARSLRFSPGFLFVLLVPHTLGWSRCRCRVSAVRYIGSPFSLSFVHGLPLKGVKICTVQKKSTRFISSFQETRDLLSHTRGVGWLVHWKVRWGLQRVRSRSGRSLRRLEVVSRAVRNLSPQTQFCSRSFGKMIFHASGTFVSFTL